MSLPYNKTVLSHGKNPQHFHIIANPTAAHEVSNAMCGDHLHLMLNIENGIIKDIGWQGEGCLISQATASLLGSYIHNKSISTIQTISEQDILDMLGVPLSPNRRPCATLCLKVLHKCLSDISFE